MGGFASLYLASVFAYAGTAFGKMKGLNSNISGGSSLVKNFIMVAGPASVGVAFGVKYFGSFEALQQMQDGEQAEVATPELLYGPQPLYL